MTLREYLSGKGWGGAADLARNTGLSPTAVSQLVRGADVRLSTAARIVAATGGAVTLADLAHAVSSGKRDKRAGRAATSAGEGAGL